MAEWTKKDLIGLEYLSREEIEHILTVTDSFKEVNKRAVKKVPVLRGKTVVSLFYEPSTRTLASFELAARRLSCDVMSLPMKTSSVTKGETLVDTGRNIEAMNVDIIIVRHSMSGAPYVLSQALNASVVNAGDGWHEHPTQALLDMYTIKKKLGKIEGLKVCIIGDIAHSRVARSNIWGLTKLGAKVTLCAPKMLLPMGVEKFGVNATSNLDEAIKDADAINVLRMQFERDSTTAFPEKRKYIQDYSITSEVLAKAKKDIVVMHPGPINRGIEMSSEVADGENSVILEQVTNGVAVRMAVLYLVSNGKEKL
ncbi:MAG TPA: aspartate carbamoyltransferase catalytic subunit [Elusimicrobiales bacterium]|nr:aspartate carbamoyltransferase catalytic subunit [Elusimicrobiales bacterium]